MKVLDKKEAIDRLVLLYFVEKAGSGVSNTQITQFVLECGYMEYLDLQQNIAYLLKENYFKEVLHNNKNLFEITNDGIETLFHFTNLIPKSVKNSINDYLIIHKNKIRKEKEVCANFFKIEDEYIVKCALTLDTGDTLMDISINVANKERANQICNNWINNTNDVYTAIISILSSDNK